MEQNIISKIIANYKGGYCNLNNIEKNYLKEQFYKRFGLTLNTSCGSCLMDAIYRVGAVLEKEQPKPQPQPTQPKIDLNTMKLHELNLLATTLGLNKFRSKKQAIEALEEVV